MSQEERHCVFYDSGSHQPIKEMRERSRMPREVGSLPFGVSVALRVLYLTVSTQWYFSWIQICLHLPLCCNFVSIFTKALPFNYRRWWGLRCFASISWLVEKVSNFDVVLGYSKYDHLFLIFQLYLRRSWWVRGGGSICNFFFIFFLRVWLTWLNMFQK